MPGYEELCDNSGRLKGIPIALSGGEGIMRLNLAGFSRLCARLILLAALIQPAFAGLRPSLEYAAWQATDIVLVDATSKADVFEVAESWKGDLSPGDRITVPEFKLSPNAVPISLYPKNIRSVGTDDGGFSTQIPKLVAGSQMVLFLKRRKGSETLPPATEPSPPIELQYSTVFNDPEDCAVWIESAQLYHFMQWIYPGPSFLVAWDMSVSKLKDQMTEIVVEQQDLAEVVKVEDGGERAERLKPYVLSGVPQARQFALQELGKCGPAASATIREMLDDPTFADDAADVIKAYAEAGGETVAEELNFRLQRELEFWRATAPSLSEGWWNQDSSPQAPLRERYSQTLELIRGLTLTHYPAALSTVIELRDLWHFLPQLNDRSGLNQMAEECDELIEHLQGN